MAPFEQLTERSIDCLKESILKRLHDHSFTNIIFDLPSNLHWAHLKLCARLGVGIGLLTHSIIIFSHVALDVFSTTLHTGLGLSHPFNP